MRPGQSPGWAANSILTGTRQALGCGVFLGAISRGRSAPLTRKENPGRELAGASQSIPQSVRADTEFWSVQKRSSRCSDLLSTENSSALMPPTCSTVRTCFW